MRKCQLLNYRRPSPSLSISTSRILEIATSGLASLESTVESGMRLFINYVSILGGGGWGSVPLGHRAKGKEALWTGMVSYLSIWTDDSKSIVWDSSCSNH